MRKFIISILGATLFFLGLGALVENSSAKFKSDEKALELIRQARKALGGDSAIDSIKSLRITGRTAKTFRLNGAERTESGDTEIALALPDKLMKMTKLGDGSATGEQLMRKQVDVVVVGDKPGEMKVTVDAAPGDGNKVTRIVIKKEDGTVQELTGADAEKFIAADRADGANVERVIVRTKDGKTEEIKSGEPHVIVLDGKAADGQEITTPDGNKIIVRKMEGGQGGATFTTTGDGKHVMFDRKMAAAEHHGAMRQNEMLRLTLGLLLTAPQGIEVNYTFGGEGNVDGTPCNIVNAEFAGSTYKIYLSQSTSLPVMMSFTGFAEPAMVTFTRKVPAPGETADSPKENMMFKRIGPAEAASTEYSVRFSDYRSVNGVQLPFTWTQTAGGAADETFSVTAYEVNPANIADKFKEQQHMMIRTKKIDGQ